MLKIEEINKSHLIQRNLFVSIEPWLDSKECIFITGSRQVGKNASKIKILKSNFNLSDYK